MRLEPEQKLLATFSYTSLTDVVMLLLIFFLLSSSFISEPTISVQLPNAESSDPKTEQTIAITLTEKGALYLNDAPVRLADLGKTLAQRLKESPDRAVQIRADKAVTLERAVQIVDIAKAAGATRFLIATEPPGTRR
ncbi:MAG: putative biopolymer transport protein related to ExbD [Bacteroidetes bacterium]|nr:putative biopolymer transport protein related to ExbD [Bacteroidota bacterium]